MISISPKVLNLFLTRRVGDIDTKTSLWIAFREYIFIKAIFDIGFQIIFSNRRFNRAGISRYELS